MDEARFKESLVGRYFVRCHMSIMVTTTTCIGLIASKLLLVAGVTHLLIRYPAAILIAYAAFFGLTWIWLRYIGSTAQEPGSAPDVLDLMDLDFPSSDVFGSGDSAGAGASESFSSGESDGGLPGADLDEGLWILILLAALILVIFGSGIYLIYAAPDILPEVALNAVLASSLAASKGSWMRGLLRTTWIPLVLVLITAIGFAGAAQHYCPGADRIAQAWHCAVELHPKGHL